MENEIVVSDNKTMTVTEMRNQVNLIQEIMQEVMIGPTKENPQGVHYGLIPGCGNKPTLLKSGAEKLSLTFRLRPIINNDRDIAITELPNGHRDVRVYCHIINAAGHELATGIGSCSTMESKFRYRGGEKIPTGKLVPTQYWNLKKEGKISAAQELIGGQGYGTAKIAGTWQICKMGEKMENPDIADTYNTVLKIAKKRSYIDGILSATAASDIFTQDIEDLPEGEILDSAEISKNGKPSVQMPREKAQPVQEPQTPAGTEEMPALSEEPAEGQLGEQPDFHTCTVCGGDVPQKSYDYSMKKYKRAICFNCQKNFNGK